MGRDKALLELEGETLVARGLRTLGEVCAEVAIAGGAEELRRFGRVIADGVPGCGPLGGIVAGLEETAWEWNLFLAVDVPFVPREAWLRVIAAAAEADGAAVMVRVQGRVQPLCAAYRRTAVGRLRAELDGGRLKVTQAAAEAGGVVYVDFEKDAGWFRNFNNALEFEAAALPLQ